MTAPARRLHFPENVGLLGLLGLVGVLGYIADWGFLQPAIIAFAAFGIFCLRALDREGLPFPARLGWLGFLGFAGFLGFIPGLEYLKYFFFLFGFGFFFFYLFAGPPPRGRELN